MARDKTRTKPKQRQARALSAPASFGAVSQINTAPVSVGNSVRGSKPRITQSTNGARVVGRDFAFALSSSAAAITNFELIGGMPLTPCALPSSVLRNYCQMFQKFKVNKIVVHYITSSPTSQAGDILFYYERDSNSPMMDYSSSSFLPFVLSDPHTVIGPQWTNHSMLVNPTSEWKTTLYGNQSDLNEDKAGTLFMFSKTNAANSPGYVLIDYDISFRELSINPRAGTLPVARAQSSFICLTNTSTTTLGGSISFQTTVGKNIANVTSAMPTGCIEGDIYKVVFQITASTAVNAAWSGTPAPTTTNLLRYAEDRTLTLDDGFTCYALVLNSANVVNLYPTLEDAITTSRAIESGVASTSPTVNICAEIQLVRNVTDFTQSSY